MCRLPPPSKPKQSRSFLLLTHDSFVYPHLDGIDKDDGNKRRNDGNAAPKNPHLHGLGGPSLPSTLLTVAFYVAALFAVEHLARHVIGSIPDLHPILEIERNRHILARHIAVDFFSLVVCTFVAIANRHVCEEMISHGMSFVSNGGGKKKMEEEAETETENETTAAKVTTTTTTTTTTALMCAEMYEDRIFKYHPGSQRLALFFFVYQVKNMLDTIYWGDGIEFVLHHLLAGATAWGGMYPGCCHFYTLFYFGFSEVSTAILCLLANFDPAYGIAGLGEVFPVTKLVLGGLFVASFVVCRLILWPFATYYFARDAMMAIKSDHPRADGRRGYLWVIYCCCVGLSLIQLLFVAMIVKTGREEVAKFMNW